MIPDIDIHRSAWLMIRRDGDDAAIEAAIRGDDLLAKGDLDGLLVWLAIERLQARQPDAGKAVH